MVAFRQHWLSDDSSAHPPGRPASETPPDGQLLDAFSRTVVHVAELLRPAVVNLRAPAAAAPDRASCSPPTASCSPITMSSAVSKSCVCA